MKKSQNDASSNPSRAPEVALEGVEEKTLLM